jgi:exoribonuclease-2
MAREQSLVAYKGRPALVGESGGGKIGITLPGGEKLRVREKDIDPVHPGPVRSLDEICGAGGTDGGAADAAIPEAGREAWELLRDTLPEGGTIPLRELAELVYGEYGPAAAWGAYALLLDGLYFKGTAQRLGPREAAEVEAGEAKRRAKRQDGLEREDFITRLGAGRADPAADGRFMQDVEALAWGGSEKRRTMRELGREEIPGEAHRLLLETGFWTPMVNPHPRRFGLSLLSPDILPPPPPPEERRDLTALAAYAVDSPWSADPDDAVSIGGDEGDGPAGRTLYVHVADPAASILPDSPAEREAGNRGATLYLPEGTSRMLAEGALSLFALGLAEISPALTFKRTLDESGAPAGVDIFPSLVRVTRLSYAEADALAAGGGPAEETGPRRDLAALCLLGERNLRRRLEAGAARIDLPETHIEVTGGRVTVEPIPSFRSAAMVRECMLLAGEGAALWAGRHLAGAFPYIGQEAGDFPAARGQEPLEGPAGSWQLRRCMRPRILSARALPHRGLGLDAYAQVTSPLRRYTDLLAHMQIRAALGKREPMTEEDLTLRLGAGEAAARAVTQAERASRAHWTAVYLLDKKDSVWEAVVMEKKGPRRTVLIPALGLETQTALGDDVNPNDTVRLRLKSVRIPAAEAVFAAEDE